MIKAALLAGVVSLLAPANIPTPFRPFVCRDNAELNAALRKSFDQIRRDRLTTLPWRVFIVMKEFEREGFIVTPRIRATVCDGDPWLYGERFEQPFLLEDIGPPQGPIQLRDETWNHVG